MGARSARPYIWMVLVALAIRLVLIPLMLPERMEPRRDHYEFAYEPGRVARSIALGHGMSDPLFGNTGPTAVMTPLYPYLLAGIFQLFGIYSTAAAVAILSLNSLFSALTCIPIFFIAQRSFGLRVAKWAGWLWAFSPYGIYFSTDWIWPTCLTVLLLPLLFLACLCLSGDNRASSWAGFGLLCGVATLNDPVILSSVPLLAVWGCFRLQRQKRPWLKAAAIAAGVFLIVVAPWFVRNYRVFHAFIPFRDGIGLELYVGNNGYAGHWANGSIRPANNATELGEWQRTGEIAYMAHKKQQAMEFISAHRGWFVWMSFRRAVYLWTGYWSFRRGYLKEEPLDPPNILLCTSIAVLAFVGLFRGMKKSAGKMFPFLILTAFYPLVYYFTHPEVYYMRPLDPILAVLAASTISRLVPRKASLELREA